ncbi:hypothetical protein [Paracoccus hibiscisoli]|uniref:Transposase n=1 Tax=Paracoccus hibiscisoli TaxID=2023261 RepID=A0A4U0RDM3_9RHOB|nr:hypothetical protein [Paracoccus hibiscisoli]TJZ86254.1 hypothetical protein FA740_05055 [Paracoccus hibiscisoli]
MVINLFWLTEAQIAYYLQVIPKSHGHTGVGDLWTLNGVIIINRNGLSWCDTPGKRAPAKAFSNSRKQ